MFSAAEMLWLCNFRAIHAHEYLCRFWGNVVQWLVLFWLYSSFAYITSYCKLISVPLLFRPRTDECSRGDLDGDAYFVCWSHVLIPSLQFPPMDYTPASKKVLDHDVPIKVLLNILSNPHSWISSYLSCHYTMPFLFSSCQRQ